MANKPVNSYLNNHHPKSPESVVSSDMGKSVGYLQENKKKGINPWLILVMGFGIISIIILFILFVFGIYILYTSSDRILPGVMVGETPIGNLRIEEAEQVIDKEWNHAILYVSDGVTHWQSSPAEFGLQVDTGKTVEQAYTVGRGADGLSEIINILLNGRNRLMPVVSLDVVTAETRLELMAALIDEDPVEASIIYLDEDWQAVAGVEGIALDVETCLNRLDEEKTLIMMSDFFQLTTTSISPQVERTDEALAELKPQLEKPILLQAYDPIRDEEINWSVSPGDYASWIRIELLQETPFFNVDQGAVEAYFLDWEKELGSDRELLPFDDMEGLAEAWRNDQRYMMTIWHKPTEYRVQSGDSLTSLAWKNEMPYWLILEANPQLESMELITGTDLIIPSRNELIPLPVIRNKRIIISLSEQRMWTYENGEERSVHIISSGVDESPTLPGVYQIRTHQEEAYASVWDLYMPHFMGIYEGWPGFMNGIHGLPLLSSGVRLWGSVLGEPASFGCIILTLQDAENLYYWAEEGVVVEVRK